MQCPSDASELTVSRRGGVEIDSCPHCHGVWLDRGELDKIIARADIRTSPRFPPSMRPFGARSVPTDRKPVEAAGNPPESASNGNWLADLFDESQPDDRPPHGQ